MFEDAPIYRFDVSGTPAPQGSMRAVMHGGRAAVIHNSPKGLMDWRTSIAFEARAARVVLRDDLTQWVLPMLEGPVEIWAYFRMQRPKGHFGARGNILPSAPPRPAFMPDLDKLARALLDALTGVLYADDSQVVTLHVQKDWADYRGPGVLVTAGNAGRGGA